MWGGPENEHAHELVVTRVRAAGVEADLAVTKPPHILHGLATQYVSTSDEKKGGKASHEPL